MTVEGAVAARAQGRAAAESTRLVVGIGDMQITQGTGQLVMTFGLGSCIGLVLWDPEAKAGALLHAMLPTSRLASDRLRDNPFMFVDIGVPETFRRCYAQGLEKARLQCYVGGGACTHAEPEKDVFQIGLKNLAMLDALLEKNNIVLRGRHVGGHHSRTLTLDVSSGKVSVQFGREVLEL